MISHIKEKPCTGEITWNARSFYKRVLYKKAVLGILKKLRKFSSGFLRPKKVDKLKYT